MGQRQKGCSFLQVELQSGAPQEAGGHMWEGHPSSPGTPHIEWHFLSSQNS